MTDFERSHPMDTRDAGSYDFLKIIDDFDAKIAEVNSLLTSAKDLASGELKTKLRSLEHDLQQWRICLPDVGAQYFDHDAARFFRAVTDYLKIEDPNALTQRRERMMNNWEICRLVMQDIAIRCTDGEDKISEKSKEIDKNHTLDRLVKTCQYLMLGYSKYVKGLSIVDVDPELIKNKNIRIELPHGVIANLINNFISNASDPSVSPPDHVGTLKLEFGVDNNEVVLSFFDNCNGIGQDKMDKIYQKGFSEGKVGRGRGLGLAYADSRINSAGGKLFLASREKKIADGETSFGDINYYPENMDTTEREGIKLDEVVDKHSTCFQIRIPVSAK